MGLFHHQSHSIPAHLTAGTITTSDTRPGTCWNGWTCHSQTGPSTTATSQSVKHTGLQYNNDQLICRYRTSNVDKLEWTTYVLVYNVNGQLHDHWTEEALGQSNAAFTHWDKALCCSNCDIDGDHTAADAIGAPVIS